MGRQLLFVASAEPSTLQARLQLTVLLHDTTQLSPLRFLSVTRVHHPHLAPEIVHWNEIMGTGKAWLLEGSLARDRCACAALLSKRSRLVCQCFCLQDNPGSLSLPCVGPPKLLTDGDHLRLCAGLLNEPNCFLITRLPGAGIRDLLVPVIAFQGGRGRVKAGVRVGPAFSSNTQRPQVWRR